MRIARRCGFIAGVVGVLAPPLATVAFTEQASAAFPPGAFGVVCTSLHGKATTLTANLTGCTSGSSGGGGAIVSFTPSGGDVTWANGSTTDYTATATNPSTGCPAGWVAFKIKGAVTSGTNANTPVGQTVKMTVCSEQGGKQKLKNEVGTTIKF